MTGQVDHQPMGRRSRELVLDWLSFVVPMIAFAIICFGVVRLTTAERNRAMEANGRFVYVQNRGNVPIGISVRDWTQTRVCWRGTVDPGQRRRVRTCNYYAVLYYPGRQPDARMTVMLGHVYEASWRGEWVVNKIDLE